MIKKNMLLTILILLAISLNFGYASTFTSGAPSQDHKMVNINTSGLEQLCTIPGIGKKMATRIIDFRKKHGKFRKIADLMKVRGIGEKRFKKIKKRLTIQ